MHRRSSFIAGLIVFVTLLVASLPAGVAEAQAPRCFPETGQCIAGPIRTYWERNGGLSVFGFPITEQRVETIEGKALPVQWFERDRLEIQPEGYVTQGLLGRQRMEQLGIAYQPGSGDPRNPPGGCIVDDVTRHTVCGRFASTWRSKGYLQILGRPLTAEFITQIGDKVLTVQYFERRRFELHGDQVLFGLLGREVLTPPQPPNVDPCTQIPANTNAEIQPRCAPHGTVFEAAGGGFVPGERVGVYITLPDQSVFGARFQLEADNSGVACCVTFNSGVLPRDSSLDGIWAMTFEGTESRRTAVAYFRILR